MAREKGPLDICTGIKQISGCQRLSFVTSGQCDNISRARVAKSKDSRALSVVCTSTSQSSDDCYKELALFGKLSHNRSFS